MDGLQRDTWSTNNVEEELVGGRFCRGDGVEELRKVPNGAFRVLSNVDVEMQNILQ